MKVLSLFDGISCGMIALERLQTLPDNYCITFILRGIKQ